MFHCDSIIVDEYEKVNAEKSNLSDDPLTSHCCVPDT